MDAVVVVFALFMDVLNVVEIIVIEGTEVIEDMEDMEDMEVMDTTEVVGMEGQLKHAMSMDVESVQMSMELVQMEYAPFTDVLKNQKQS